MKHEWAFIVVVLLVAAGLRLFALGRQSLWIDEVSQVRSVEEIDTEGFGVVTKWDNVSPLSHWILWASMKVTGKSDAAVRLPSAIFGILAVLAVYLLAREIVSPAVGITSAAFVAVSPFAVWHSQDARMYSQVICLSAWAMLVFWKATKERGSTAHWALFTAATILGVYTHQYFALLTITCGLFLAVQADLRRGRLWKWACTQVVAGLVFLPWFVHSMHRLGSGAGIRKAGAVFWIPYSVFTFLFGFSLGPSVRELHWNARLSAIMPSLAMIAPIAICAAGLAAVGLVRLLRGGTSRAGTFFLACFALPIGLAVAVPFVIGNISYNVRYVSVAFPAFAVLVSAGAARSRRSAIIALMTAVTAAGVVWSLGNYFLNERYSKADMRSAAAFLAEEIEGGDAVIISSYTGVAPLEHYGFAVPGDAIAVHAGNLSDVLARIEKSGWDDPRRVWLVESRSWESDPGRKLPALLAGSRALLLERRWPGVCVRSYGRPLRSGQTHGNR